MTKETPKPIWIIQRKAIAWVEWERTIDEDTANVLYNQALTEVHGLVRLVKYEGTVILESD